MARLILPGDPEFDIALATPPPDWKIQSAKVGYQVDYVMDAEKGIFRTATQEELNEYLYGGEYEELVDFEDEWD